MTFLLANWRWLLPALLCAAAIGYGTIERANYLGEKAGRAADLAAAQQAALQARATDAARTAELTVQSAADKAALQARLTDAQVALSKVQSTAACGSTPAARAFDDAVRLLPGDPPRAGATRSARSGAH